MNDNVINGSHRFGKGSDGPVEPEREKFTPTLYRIHFKDGTSKEVTGYLGVSPLFVAVTDSREKILFMLPHGDYSYVEAIEEDIVDVELDTDEYDPAPAEDN